jgi:uncharacterized cupredoxin-like copper-binding protein
MIAAVARARPAHIVPGQPRSGDVIMRGRITAVALLSAALLAGCGGDDAENAAQDAAATVEAEATEAVESQSEQAPAGAVDVALSEWKVEPAEATAAAGKVVFNADNTGDAPHELEVIQTDTQAGDFPVEAAVAKVDGEQVGEVTGIAPGANKTLEVELEAGHYALICNLPGHYEPGMHADFTVE